MSAGRTSWWSKDAAWHRRELQVEIGDQFGAEGLVVLDVLSSWAQEQKATGDVKGGFRSLSRETFVSSTRAREIMEFAEQIGALDELEVDADGRRFQCRVSGFRADQERGRAAVRQAAKRERDAQDEPGDAVTDRDVSRPVTETPPPDQTRPDQEQPRGARSVRFGGRIVPQATVAVAEAILTDFNERADTSYKPFTAAGGKPTEPFKRILGAVVEHDGLTAEEGVRINVVGLADRFWEGPAQPGHVWGPNVVERNRQKASANGGAGGLSEREKAIARSAPLLRQLADPDGAA